MTTWRRMADDLAEPASENAREVATRTFPTVSPVARDFEIAVIIPCLNEEKTIGAVIDDFRRMLPRALIYVYDNNSRDQTATIAKSHGAIVRRETLPGKGNVIRRMFSDIEADIYVLVDGDSTYEAASAPIMVNHLIENQLDMVVAKRCHETKSAYPHGHRFGNLVFAISIRLIFGRGFTDVLSGYRVFSRRFVKSFPALSTGFETETELTVHALELNMPAAELETKYLERPAGSTSKLRTVRHGFLILWTIIRLVRAERPFAFFSIAALSLGLLSLLLGVPVVLEYLATGLVPRFPTAILSAALMICALLSFACGLILDTVRLSRRENKRMQFLTIPGIAAVSARRTGSQ